ncbi:MAG: CARDB domain-containing protein, partial [Promethearchaeota archaeon]
LLIEAMGGHESWGYTATEAKRVKALLLMSATETYPLLREGFTTSYSPELNRGGKDVHEGYGRLNIDMAIEAYTQELTLGTQTNAMIKSSSIDAFAKHGLGCHVNLISGNPYVFNLDVPGGADFDLYLYSNNPSSVGEPVLVASSTSAGLGTDEVISYTATTTGKYYLFAKAISGEGNAIISYPTLLHELAVGLEVPSSPEIGNSYLINATVKNIGTNDETDVDLFLYLDSVLVNSTTIPSLLAGVNTTITYMWTPSLLKTYNFTAYAPPVSGETIYVNNIVTRLVKISVLMNYTMVTGYPYAWIDASGGTELLLGDDDYEAIALPFNFDFYNTTFSTVYLCSNGYLSFSDSSPTEYYNVPFPSGYFTEYYMVAPFWDDLDVSYSGNVYVQSFGSYWVAEWLNVYHYDWNLVGSFEVILYETGDIVFNYDYLDYMNGYTCGLNLGVDTQYYNTYLGLSGSTDDFSIKFTYTGVDTLSITTPDSSSSWETDTSHYIYWNYFGSTSNVKLELYNNDLFEMVITPDTANDGEYYWTIPSGLTDSDQYQIKITNTTDPSIYDYSNYFEIFNPSIAVTSPDSTSSWE